MRNRIAITAPGAGEETTQTSGMLMGLVCFRQGRGAEESRGQAGLQRGRGHGEGRGGGQQVRHVQGGQGEEAEDLFGDPILLSDLCRRSSLERKRSRNRRQIRSPLQEISGCSELLSELCRDLTRRKSRRRM